MKRHQAEAGAAAAQPPLEQLHFKALYRKETYDAPTRDGWVLQVTRYRPVPQPWRQPLLDEPILLVHGWSQNRHCFTVGSFVKQLLAWGADCHLLELRGHGKSSRALQLQRAAHERRDLPADFDFGWDIDSYLLEDLPAGVAAVKARTGRDRLFYVGNSMGGMIGYGYAARHGDLAGLVAIGAPSDLGRGFPLLQVASALAPVVLNPTLDAALGAVSGLDVLRHALATALRRLRWLERAADRVAHPASAPAALRYRHLPMDVLLQALSPAATPKNLAVMDALKPLLERLGSLVNPARVSAEELAWLLRQGGEKEPRAVMDQFARWVRRDEMRCYRDGFDYKEGMRALRCPLAVVYGGLDKLASEESTRTVFRRAQSEYLVRCRVRDNSHLEMTMGSDVDRICEVIRELVLWSRRRERTRARTLAEAQA